MTGEIAGFAIVFQFSYDKDGVCNWTKEGEGCGYVEYFSKEKVKANLETSWENVHTSDGELYFLHILPC